MPFHIAESMAALFTELCSRLVAADMSYCCTAPVMRCKNVVGVWRACLPWQIVILIAFGVRNSLRLSFSGGGGGKNNNDNNNNNNNNNVSQTRIWLGIIDSTTDSDRHR